MARTYRPSARIVLVDEQGRVLLFRVVDKLSGQPPIWVTPGGGLEPGEDAATAAVRELQEETGLAVTPAELGGPVAVSRGEWEFRGQPLYSEDWYFALRARSFDVDTRGWTDLEHELNDSWRWWSTTELARTSEVVIPCDLSDLVNRLHKGSIPPEPLVLPWLTLDQRRERQE